MADFFISYISVDLLWAEWIASELTEVGYEVIFDRRDFTAGSNFVSSMRAAAIKARRTIAVLSPDYLKSGYAQDEWTAAYQRHMKSEVGALLPVKIREGDLGIFPSQITFIDLVGQTINDPSARDILLAGAWSPEMNRGPGSSNKGLEPASAEALYRRELSKPHSHLGFSFRDFIGSSPGTLQKLYIDPDLTTKLLVVDADSPYYPKRLVFKKQPALEVISLQPKLVILGRPGSGKSSLLQSLASRLARSEFEKIPTWPEESRPAIPLPLRPNDLSDWLASHNHLRPLPQLLRNYLFQRLQHLSPLLDAFDSGRAIVLIDGIDEVQKFYQRSLVRDVICEAADYFKSTRFVVSCRTIPYREDPACQFAEWPDYELDSFNDQQIDSFLRTWFSLITEASDYDIHSKSADDRQTLTQVLSTPIIRELGRNPLLLTGIATLWMRKKTIPRNRSQFYEKLVDTLLLSPELRNNTRSRPYDVSALLRKAGRSTYDLQICLDRLAYEAQARAEDGTASLRTNEVLSAFTDLHPAKNRPWARNLLDGIGSRLVFVAGGPGDNLELPHSSILEYMAGIHLTRQRNFGRATADLVANGLRWREVILLALDHLIQSGEYERPLALMEAISTSAPEGKDRWHYISFSGELFSELGLENLQRTPSGIRALEWIRQQLAELIESGALTAPARAKVGDVLGKLEDPRFAPTTHHLPSLFRGKREEMLGFVEIPITSSIAGSPGAVPYLYWISRYPTTVAQYADFISEGGYEASHWWQVPSIGWRWRRNCPNPGERWLSQGRSERDFPQGWKEQTAYPNRPVTGVCWFEAMAYASWLTVRLRAILQFPEKYSARLPTEAEWQRAAGFDQGSPFPWGDSGWTEERSNIAKSKIRKPTVVGIYPNGRSRFDVLDLGGNVGEWMLSLYSESSQSNRISEETIQNPRAIRGGSYLSEPEENSSASRDLDSPHTSTEGRGFRVVLSLPPDRLG